MKKLSLPRIMANLGKALDALDKSDDGRLLKDRLVDAERAPAKANVIHTIEPQRCAWCSHDAWVRMFGIEKHISSSQVERVQLFQCRKCHKYTVLRWQEK